MWIASLKQLSHYSGAVTNVLSFIIELAQFVVAVIQQDRRWRRRRRGKGNGTERFGCLHAAWYQKTGALACAAIYVNTKLQ